MERQREERQHGSADRDHDWAEADDTRVDYRFQEPRRLFLIVTFSAGLAAVLIAVSLLVVYVRRFVTKSPQRWTVS